MSSLNRIQLIGNIGHTPKIKTLENGSRVASFTLATNTFYKDKAGNKVKQTEWHNIIAWGRLATLTENYLFSGNSVYIDGRLTYRKYTGSDQTEKKTTEIICDDIILIDKKNQPVWDVQEDE